MKLDDVIHEKVQRLPEPVQREVLGFVEFVAQRDVAEDRSWSEMSVAGALRQTEPDAWPEYSDGDIKDRWA